MNEEVIETERKVQTVLWLLELKSVEKVNEQWLETYRCEPPSEITMKNWMENFKNCGNVEGKKEFDKHYSESNKDIQLSSSSQSLKSSSCGHSFNDKTITLENIRKRQEDFCNERDWNQYHSPRNVLLALVGEVGELAEIFQWKGEVKTGLPNFTPSEKEHVGEEISDVLIYLIRLADRCQIDLPSAVVKKFEKNAQKYPANKVYGKSKKYNEYQKS